MTSAILPNRTSGALRRVLRNGRLEGDQLVGNGNSDREDEGDQDDEGVSARTREFFDALCRGDVTNAGAAENSDAFISALETAYGAPPQQTPLTAPSPTSSAPPGLPPKKGSRFRLKRAVPPPTIAEDEGLREGGATDTADHGAAPSTTS